MILILVLILTTMTTPTLALEYTVDGPEQAVFGKSTSVDIAESSIPSQPENINRSKDSSFIPPAFGSPTSNTPGTGELLTPNISEVPQMQIGASSGYSPTLTNTSESYSSQTITINNGSGAVIIPPAPEPNIPYTPSTLFTLPDNMYYSDGSIGTLRIPEISLTVKVYENESLENLKKGAGHFKSTSCWDGNVGIAGHNRGVTNHFGKIHTLSRGDKIKYTTVYGTRTYEVFYVGKIDYTDFSRLERSDENMITLITCVMNTPTKRWCVQAREVD